MAKGERSGYRQDPLISVVHRDTYPLRQKGKSTGLAETPPDGQARPDGQAEILSARHANHTAGGKAQSYGRQARPDRQAETLTPAGRDPHPRGRQPGHQGERVSVKETSHTQRLQPVH